MMSAQPSRGIFYRLRHRTASPNKVDEQVHSIPINENTGPRNLTNDTTVLCWISAEDQEWGTCTLRDSRNVKVGIIRLDFKLDEPKDAQISEFDLDIIFSPEKVTPTAEPDANSTLYVFGEPYPSYAEGPFTLNQNDWNLRFNPNITVLGNGGSLFDLDRPASVTSRTTWRFQAFSKAVDSEKRGTRWKYEVFDFKQGGANRGPWKGAVAIVHSDQAIQVRGELTMKAYKSPRHFKSKRTLPQNFVFQPRICDADLTKTIASLKKEIDDAYKTHKQEIEKEEVARLTMLRNFGESAAEASNTTNPAADPMELAV